MPYTLFDFFYWVMVAVVAGLILTIIFFMCKKTNGWIGSLNRLSREVKEDRKRIEELERKYKERYG
jgi:hypothetical protein